MGNFVKWKNEKNVMPIGAFDGLVEVGGFSLAVTNV